MGLTRGRHRNRHKGMENRDLLSGLSLTRWITPLESSFWDRRSTSSVSSGFDSARGRTSSVVTMSEFYSKQSYTMRYVANWIEHWYMDGIWRTPLILHEFRGKLVCEQWAESGKLDSIEQKLETRFEKKESFLLNLESKIRIFEYSQNIWSIILEYF